jgi:hypothetical protein
MRRRCAVADAVSLCQGGSMWIWWTWLACRGPDGAPPEGGDDGVEATASTGETAGSGDSGPTEPTEPDRWVVDEELPTRATVQWSPREGTARLHLVDVDGEHVVEGDGLAGELVVAGLPSGTQLQWQLTVGDETLDDAGWATVDVPPPPPELDPWTLQLETADAQAPEHWFLTIQFTFGADKPSYAVIVDGEGRPRWWRRAQSEHRVLRAHLSVDGRAVEWASNDADRSADDGYIVHDPFVGAPVTTYTPGLHHDFVPTVDGYDYMAHVYDVADLGDGPEPVATDAIRRIERGSTGAYEEVFDFFSDWPSPPSRPCSHATFDNFVPGHTEWTHGNSLVAAADGDGWWLLARYLDQIARVGGDGTLRGIVGGDDPTWPHAGDRLPFAHGHFSSITDEGHLLVFSNGDHDHQAEGSRVVELAVDEEAGTVEVIGTVPEPEGRFVGFLGDAVRWPDGHTLVTNPKHGIYELDAEHQTVWHLAHGRPTEIGRVVPIAPLY